MDDQPRTDQHDKREPDAVVEPSFEPSAEATRDEIVREGRRRAAIWGVLTGLVMTVLALGCVLLLYLAVGR